MTLRSKPTREESAKLSITAILVQEMGHAEPKREFCTYINDVLLVPFDDCINERRFNFSRAASVYSMNEEAYHVEFNDELVETDKVLSSVFSWELESKKQFPISFRVTRDIEEQSCSYELEYLLIAGKTYKTYQRQFSVQPLTIRKDSTTAILKRHIVKSGLHKELISEIEISSPIESDCAIVMIEVLSESVYVDEYEVDEIERFGGPEVYLFNNIDLEKPTYFSNQNIAIITYAPARKNKLSFNISLPIHMRYQKPSEKYEKLMVTIPPPKVFIECKKGDVKQKIIHILEGNFSNSQECVEVKPSETWSSVSTWIPTGQPRDSDLVNVATIVVSSLGALCVIYTILS